MSAGWPILGDPIYGHGGAMGLQLHAHAIAVPLYKNKEPVIAAAPLPAHMRETLAQFHSSDIFATEIGQANSSCSEVLSSDGLWQ